LKSFIFLTNKIHPMKNSFLANKFLVKGIDKNTEVIFINDQKNNFSFETLFNKLSPKTQPTNEK